MCPTFSKLLGQSAAIAAPPPPVVTPADLKLEDNSIAPAPRGYETRKMINPTYLAQRTRSCKTICGALDDVGADRSCSSQLERREDEGAHELSGVVTSCTWMLPAALWMEQMRKRG